MTGPVDLSRVRRALDALDVLVRRFPGLRGERARLSRWLDDHPEGDDDGARHGNEAEDR